MALRDVPDHDDRPEVAALFANLKAALPQLQILLEKYNGDREYEDRVYRFYDRSYKVLGYLRVPRFTDYDLSRSPASQSRSAGIFATPLRPTAQPHPDSGSPSEKAAVASPGSYSSTGKRARPRRRARGRESRRRSVPA